MISGHPSVLYDTMLAGWTRIAQQVTTHACVRTEVIWFNFTPQRVHSSAFAGRNRTDRQRIKRSAAALAKRYRQMSAGERLAMAWAIMAVAAEEWQP
ncbi:MAG: hypothetical protein OXE94_03930 [Aestuariivita sp.]|nr:hypothetical protein [Aestuariivita sp.]MCY4202622.1 hypothetical protein [Aestuariivita sp.]